MTYQQKSHTVSVPRGTGKAGLLRAVDGVLQLPSVQNVTISADGTVTTTYLAPVGEEELGLPNIVFDDLSPYAVARNGQITEVLPATYGAAGIGCLFLLFRLLAAARLHPTGWVVSPESLVRPWVQHHVTGHLGDDPSSLLGLPMYIDKDAALTPEVLLLGGCTTYGAPFSDTTHTLKVIL